jgi:hypothetical protein
VPLATLARFDHPFGRIPPRVLSARHRCDHGPQLSHQRLHQRRPLPPLRLCIAVCQLRRRWHVDGNDAAHRLEGFGGPRGTIGSRSHHRTCRVTDGIMQR